MEKLIITAVMVGAEVTKEQNPALPVTAEEIGEEAYRCYRAGASIIHLHVRDGDGRPTQDREVFRRAIEEIKKRCDVIVQVSTGGAVGMTAEERMQPLELKPEMATLTTGTCNFGPDIFENPEGYIETFALKMKEYGIKPEIEVFERGMINNALKLVKKGILSMPLHFDFVMGVPGAITGEVRDLVYLVDSIPHGSTWTVAGIGRHETSLALAAIAMGGNVRVGFEDNIYYNRGVLAESNAQLVERIARISRDAGREVATPDEARKILGISGQ
jgi:3-keto-5-aminohexanoate cleavage enzyme